MIKFCVKFGKTAAETFETIERVYQEDSLASVFWWYKAFLEGPEELADEARAGWSSTSSSDDNARRVRELSNTDLINDCLFIDIRRLKQILFTRPQREIYRRGNIAND